MPVSVSGLWGIAPRLLLQQILCLSYCWVGGPTVYASVFAMYCGVSTFLSRQGYVTLPSDCFLLTGLGSLLGQGPVTAVLLRGACRLRACGPFRCSSLPFTWLFVFLPTRSVIRSCFAFLTSSPSLPPLLARRSSRWIWLQKLTYLGLVTSSVRHNALMLLTSSASLASYAPGWQVPESGRRKPSFYRCAAQGDILLGTAWGCLVHQTNGWHPSVEHAVGARSRSPHLLMPLD